MSANDLSRWVTSDVDFYELLGLPFENVSESELRRAYRKTALKYHPDKVGKDFDAAKYELFQAAHEILADADLKAKYDHARSARLQRERANLLFEGRRRQMKEDLEARERGGLAHAGTKRPRGDGVPAEMQQEFRKLAEEGKRRRAARADMINSAANPVSPAPAAATSLPAATPGLKQTNGVADATQDSEPEEDEIERLERRIREAEEAKARRRAEKKARKGGNLMPVDSSSVADQKGTKTDPELKTAELGSPGSSATIPARHDALKGLKAGERSAMPSSSPKSSSVSGSTDFAATMARLRAAQQQRQVAQAQK